MMAQKRTTSQRSTRRRGQNVSSRSGKASSTSRKRSNQGADGSRPAEEALHGRTEVDRQYRYYERREEEDRTGPPDVLLDVPELRVDLIHIELDDLDAHVALKARVLNLVKLNVGLDVHLSRTKLDIKGVQAELLLKARLDHVTAIVDRLMTSLDRNPELVKGLSRAVSDIGAGAGEAVDKTGDAAKDIGKGAQSAVKDVGHGAGEAVGDVGQGAGQAVGDVGQGAGQAVGGVGQGAGQAVGDVGQGAGKAVGNLDQLVGGVGQTVGQAGQALGGVGQGAGQLAQGAGQTVGGVAQGGQSAGQSQNGGQQQGQHGQPNGGADTATPGRLAKEAARMLARELGHAATDEARDLGFAATRKVRELGERREQRRVEKYNATETAVRVADELGVDLAQLEGSGYGGRITVKDVREATQA
jgi:2-oxoacid dehydrogenase-like protein with E3 subunit-binding domain